jgi:hypothetical protein
MFYTVILFGAMYTNFYNYFVLIIYVYITIARHCADNHGVCLQGTRHLLPCMHVLIPILDKGMASQPVFFNKFEIQYVLTPKP